MLAVRLLVASRACWPDDVGSVGRTVGSRITRLLVRRWTIDDRKNAGGWQGLASAEAVVMIVFVASRLRARNLS